MLAFRLFFRRVLDEPEEVGIGRVEAFEPLRSIGGDVGRSRKDPFGGDIGVGESGGEEGRGRGRRGGVDWK